MRECITHHICDCKQAELERLREALEKISKFFINKDGFCGGHAVEIAREALGDGK
jgi:hypothetical protein